MLGSSHQNHLDGGEVVQLKVILSVRLFGVRSWGSLLLFWTRTTWLFTWRGDNGYL
jgi:hypothetical protein